MPGKNSRHTIATLVITLLMLGMSGHVSAVSRDDPINIEADSAELKDDFSLYTGSVRLTQGGMVLKGDRLVVRKGSGGNFSLSLSGHPASIYQPPEVKGGQPIQGRANKIDYGSGQEILELQGNATIDRGGENISGNSIRYNVKERRTLVNNNGSGASGGRVKITLQPGK